MSQDSVADTLNQIMNAKKAGKTNLVIKRYSKLLIKILDLAKDSGYLNYQINENEIKIEINKLNEIMAVKPRYTVSIKTLDKYVRRFLPAKNFGFIIVSTNKGLMRHYDAQEQNLGGCIIAYMF